MGGIGKRKGKKGETKRGGGGGRNVLRGREVFSRNRARRELLDGEIVFCEASPFFAKSNN